MVKFLTVFSVLISVSFADLFIYQPDPVNLENLKHDYAYTWAGIDFSDLEAVLNTTDAKITGATLFVDDIYNSDTKENSLFINMLADVSSYAGGKEIGPGVIKHWDANTGIANYFLDDGILLEEFTDSDRWNTKDNIIINFNMEQLAMLKDNLGNANFGFGFDPDCAYYNSGVRLVISTPEPALVSMLGFGLLSLTLLRRKKR